MEKCQFGGDSPQARFGHTITPISVDKALLFGGAVGDNGKYNITGDTIMCDYAQKIWKKLINKGTAPANRAAHASVIVNNNFYVFGGALGGGQFADDGLYQLNITKLVEEAAWSVRNCKGTTPGARYGHVMAYLKPFIIVYGGNSGNETIGDVWKIDVEGSCVWEKITAGHQNPPPRVYHSASMCRTGTANGMMVIFGGRGSDGVPLNDTWGLRKHRNGSFDWMKAPYKTNFKPIQRYQHCSLFVGTLLLILGGRQNQVNESLTLDVYDTDTSNWYKLPNVDRFRQACFMIDNYIYLHGGFEIISPNIPTDSMVRLDLNKIFHSQPNLFKGLAYESGNDVFTINKETNQKTRGSREHQQLRRSQQLKRQVFSHKGQREKMQVQYELQHKRNIKTNQKIRISPLAIVAQDFQIRKMSISLLVDQSRRLVGKTNNLVAKDYLEKVHHYFLNILFLKTTPFITYPLQNQYVNTLLEEMEKIFDEESALVRIRSPIKIFGDIHGQVQELNKLFQAFGAPNDEPPNGDVQYTNYLFLGDYIDRGNTSVQTILLLFALKVKFPENIILLRGSHEDRLINSSMGFGDECSSKFKENINDEYSFFSRVNKLFQKMPLAAVVDDNLFCCHGGIGNTLKFAEQIEEIKKPIKISHEPKSKHQKIAYELLWSDPCLKGEPEHTPNIQHDYFQTKYVILALKQNTKFSQERAEAFCVANNLNAIVRSHTPFAEGLHFSDSIITVFSCSDYGGQKNKSSILHISKSGEIAPKILLPTYSTKQRWLNLLEATKNNSNEQRILRRLSCTVPKK